MTSKKIVEWDLSWIPTWALVMELIKRKQAELAILGEALDALRGDHE